MEDTTDFSEFIDELTDRKKLEIYTQSKLANFSLNKCTTSDMSYFNFELNNNKNSYMISVKNKSEIPSMIILPREYNGLPVTKIKNDGFSDCTNISIVIFEDNSNIKNIGFFAFYGCTSLESIELPKSVRTIKSGAFHSCSKLQQVYLHSKYPPKLGRVVFYQNSPNIELYVPSESIDVYKDSYRWKDYERCIFPLPCNVPSSLGFFKFELNEDGKTYTVYAKNKGNLPRNLVIPSYYYKKCITIIGERGFKLSYFQSLILPEKLVIIDKFAFACNKCLKEVKIPDSLERIENHAFFIPICRSYPYILLELNALEKIIFGENSKLKYIGDNAFWGNIKLKEFVIPKGVTFIGSKTLGGTKISHINIPENVETIKSNPFDWCYHLKNINVDKKNKYYKDVDGVLYNKDETEFLGYPIGRENFSYSIPNTIKNISSNSMFYKWSADDNFRVLYVNSLEPPILPYRLYFHLPATKIYVPSCSYREYINAPIWSEIKDIIYPNNIIKDGLAIRNNTLIQYVEDKSEIIIPRNVTKVQDHALSYCTNLKNIYVEENNTSLKTVNGILFNEDLTKLIYYPPSKTEEEYEIPDDVNILGVGSFLGCENLMRIKTHKALKIIEDYTFLKCPNMKEITNIDGNDNIKSIGNYVFYMCDSIEKVKFMSIESIGKPVFSICSSLTEIIFGSQIKYMPERTSFYPENPTTPTKFIIFALVPPKLKGIRFDSEASIYVPKESLELYKEAEGWRYCSDIIYPLTEKIVQ